MSGYLYTENMEFLTTSNPTSVHLLPRQTSFSNKVAFCSLSQLPKLQIQINSVKRSYKEVVFALVMLL